MSLIAGRGCRWPPRRDSVSPVRTVVGGGRDTHDGHENSPILVFFSNLLEWGSHPTRRRSQRGPREYSSGLLAWVIGCFLEGHVRERVDRFRR